MTENHFYEIYRPLLQRIYTARENFRAEHYIKLPNIERDLANYIADASYSFAYFRAPKGAGKSTIIYNAKFIHDRAHPASENGMYIFDCRDNLSFENPRKETRYGDIDSQNKLRNFLGHFIIQKLGREKFDEGKVFCDLDFAEFCQRKFLAHIDMETKLANFGELRNDVNLGDTFLKNFKRSFLLNDEFIFSASISALIYMLSKDPESTVTIVIDNTESISFGDVCNLVEVLQKCNGVFRTNKISPTRFSILFSCRESTYEMLRVKGIENANGTQSTKQIPHSVAAPLSEILRSRTKVNIEKFDYITRNGTRINDIDAQKAFSTFVDKLADSEIPNTIAKLTNQDLALAMELLEYVTRNPALGIMEDLAWITVSDTKRLSLNEANVLACLLYGASIQKDEARYPIKDNNNIIYIPNLLYVGRSISSGIFTKLRIYQALKTFSRYSSTPLINAAEVSEAIGGALSIEASVIFDVLRSMHKDGYLLSHEGSMQDVINDYDTVRISPKLEEVVRLSQEYGILIVAFLDEISQNSDEKSTTNPFTKNSTRSNYDFLYREFKALWEIENDQLSRYFDDDGSSRFGQLFGDKIWTRHFLCSVIKRIQSLIGNEADEDGNAAQKRSSLLSDALCNFNDLKQDILSFENDYSLGEREERSTLEEIGTWSNSPDLIGSLYLEISRSGSLSEAEKLAARNLIEKLSSVLKSSHGESAKKEKAAKPLMDYVRNLNQLNTLGEDAYMAISDLITRLIS